MEPIPYLAIPHHAEQHHLHQLTYTYRKLLLDRIRLCRYAAGVGPGEQELIDAVLGEEVIPV